MVINTLRTRRAYVRTHSKSTNQHVINVLSKAQAAQPNYGETATHSD